VRTVGEDVFRRRLLLKLHLVLLLAAALFAQPDASLTEQVRRAEIAFAKTMADRDHAGFSSFLADEAIFVGPNRVLRGAKEVAAGWKRFYEGRQAPFSWAPEQVQVLDSGTLALSSGPVRNPAGKRVGTFNSVWRREPGGKWKIVLDNGCPPCDCAAR
jgi:ketosteroid isomerase-like protein